MAWTIFEILINLFQSFLVLRYIKGCFCYKKRTICANIILLICFTAYFSIYLFDSSFSLSEQLAFLIPLVHVLLLSSESKSSIAFWLLLLMLIMNLVSIITYPIFDFLSIMFDSQFLSFQLERFLCIIVTNIALYLILDLTTRIKNSCPLPQTSSCITLILILSFIYVIEIAVYNLYQNFSNESVFPFFIIYVGLLGCIILTISLFHIISSDSERENRYQAEISMMTLSKQHQFELAQMYEELTERQHDYKHHLQALQELVKSSKNSTANNYLDTLIREMLQHETIITGSSCVDALLTAKRKLMSKKGIRFIYTPYPLTELPISTLDFCSIVGNLLDNAIEGIMRIPNINTVPEQAVIHLTFSRSWDMFYIYCENPCNPSTIVKHKSCFVSSKLKNEEGLHGLGLHSIDSIASKAEGRTEYLIHDNVFYAKVVLPYLNEGK